MLSPSAIRRSSAISARGARSVTFLGVMDANTRRLCPPQQSVSGYHGAAVIAKIGRTDKPSSQPDLRRPGDGGRTNEECRVEIGFRIWSGFAGLGIPYRVLPRCIRLAGAVVVPLRKARNKVEHQPKGIMKETAIVMA